MMPVQFFDISQQVQKSLLEHQFVWDRTGILQD